MAAKIISVSATDSSYVVLPGSQGDLNQQAAEQNDTVFGQNFNSNIPTSLSWSVNANAVYKGYAGYVGTIKKGGTPTTMTAEACTLVSGKTYRITNATKQVISRADTLTILDNAVDHTADVVSFDPLFGTVTFSSGYTVIGPVTVTGKYIPLATVGTFRGYTLNMQAAAINSSDYDSLNANGGFDINVAGLKDVGIEIPGIYSASSGLPALLIARSELILEINPDGLGASGSRARGFFKCTSSKVSGNVGALEQEDTSFKLSVPVQQSGPTLELPFSWNHFATTPMPTAIKTCVDGWAAGTNVWVKYLGDGVNGKKGSGPVTNVSLTSSIDGLNTFTVTVMGSGAPVTVP